MAEQTAVTPVHEQGADLLGKCIVQTENPGCGIRGLVIGYQNRALPRFKVYRPSDGSVLVIFMESGEYKVVDKEIFHAWSTEAHVTRRIWVYKEEKDDYFEAYLVKIKENEPGASSRSGQAASSLTGFLSKNEPMKVATRTSKFEYIDPRDDTLHKINLASESGPKWGFLDAGWVVNGRQLETWCTL